MDSYSGSEPRLFISFRLGDESNGQPPQLVAEEEKMDTTDSFVTASSTVNNFPTVKSMAHGQNNNDDKLDDPERVVEDDRSLVSEGATTSLGNITVTPQDSPITISNTEATPPAITATGNVESSSTDESCGAYIARKWEQLGCSQETGTSSQNDWSGKKFSESTMMELMPGQYSPTQDELELDEAPEVAFLDSPKVLLKSSLKSRYGPSEAKVQRLSVKLSAPRTDLSGAAAGTGGLSSSEAGSEFAGEFEAPRFAEPTTNRESDKATSDAGLESEGLVGSTVADVLFAPAQANVFRVSDVASNTSVDFPESAPRVPQLSASGRALIKEYFDEATPIRLSPGHPTLALNEGQVSSLLKVVADEAVKSSLKAMENLVQQASRLSLGAQRSPTAVIPRSKKTSSQTSYAGSQSGLSSGHTSDTSGGIRSDDDFASIGYVYEHSDLESQHFTPPPTGPSGSRQIDLVSPVASTQPDSPGGQTLAALKAEAVSEKTKSGTRRRQSKKPTRPKGESRHRVPRACKIMKEAYFKGMEWTKTFVSGPVDPRWNPYKFYCQICKGNISIYGRGAREILRHHSTERHLRKDQRWRYEHLAIEDPVSGRVKHHVRGKDGRLLTPYELQLELPKFIGVELVDIGEKLPFYDEYAQGVDYMASSSDNRVRVQMSVLGNYLRSYGDISTLRNLWRDVGVVVNHQSLFTDFDWSKERLSVSIFLPLNRLKVFPSPVIVTFDLH